MTKALASLLLALAAAPLWAGVPHAARVHVQGQDIVAGVPLGESRSLFDCEDSALQATVRSCKLKADSAKHAYCLGLPVAGVHGYVYYKGDIINMAVELAGGDVDSVIGRLTSLLGTPSYAPWMDKERLFLSYKWVDKDGEVEVTKTVKGKPYDGKVRLFISSFASRPLNPDDLK